MTIFSSAEKRCFFSDELSLSIPADAQEISDEYHQALLKGQSEGKFIDFSEYPPRLVEVLGKWLSAAELARLIDDKVAVSYMSWVRFEPEYTAREQAAKTFQRAGFQGDPGSWIIRYAETASISHEDAATLIIAKSKQREAALETLAGCRLQKHELMSLQGEECQERYEEIMKIIEKTNAVLESFDSLS
ncbi:hypothetical protein [Pseudomonas soli]|uniref:hypothetical protein n=1 Tax=Pseudomonas soli TaxID=1306993 RepID=UPI0028A9896F|nr:hypothetical protein [Pseudomonas soli]